MKLLNKEALFTPSETMIFSVVKKEEIIIRNLALLWGIISNEYNYSIKINNVIIFVIWCSFLTLNAQQIWFGGPKSMRPHSKSGIMGRPIHFCEKSNELIQKWFSDSITP